MSSPLKEKLDAVWNKPHIAYPRHLARWEAIAEKGDSIWYVIDFKIVCFRGTPMRLKLETKQQRQRRIWGKKK